MKCTQSNAVPALSGTDRGNDDGLKSEEVVIDTDGSNDHLKKGEIERAIAGAGAVGHMDIELK